MKNRLVRILFLFLLVFTTGTGAIRFFSSRTTACSLFVAGSDEDLTYVVNNNSVMQWLQPTLDALSLQSKATISRQEGILVITLEPAEKEDAAILYLHGGAYINDVNVKHLYFCDRLACQTHATVVIPVYPLAPAYTYEDTYTFLEAYYPKLYKSTKHVTVMGDSAGGGLAIAWCQHVGKDMQPDHLIAISPWLDISESNPEADTYNGVDVLLDKDMLKEMGQMWAGDLSVKDYKVSPAYGDSRYLKDVTLFVGTMELFYPDITNYAQHLKELKVPVSLTVGEQQIHNYVLYDSPEAYEAFEKIVRVIQEK